mgnify:CR=1 FL=1
MQAVEAGDTAWVLMCTILVLLMTVPGLALFYAGMVRKKNVLATVMQSFAVTCLVSVLWMVVTYSLAFTLCRLLLVDFADLVNVFFHNLNIGFAI